MFFLSGEEAVKKVILEDFLASRKGRTVIIFRDEKEIPDMKEGINLFAPYYEGSFGFDPALDILAGSPTVNQGALSFAEAMVTDNDIMSARDPIWSYNSRGLFETLFVSGIQYWKFLHKNSAQQEGDLPSLTDTIFGMLDDLASSKAGGGDISRANFRFPEWWNLTDVAEQEFLKTTILAAPMNTAGSLLAVANSYTGGIMRLYSEDKSPLLFNPDWGENVFIYLPGINAPALGMLLKTAKVAWGNNLRVVACEVSSWGKRSLAVLGNFFSENHFQEGEFLMTGLSPSQEIMQWYSGPISWGAGVSVVANSYFRIKVAETTGNQNGCLTSLPVEAPENCQLNEWIELNDSGWSLKSTEEGKIQEMQTRPHIVLKPEETAQSEEVTKLRDIFSDGACPPPFGEFQSGAIIIRAGEDEFPEPEEESSGKCPGVEFIPEADPTAARPIAEDGRVGDRTGESDDFPEDEDDFYSRGIEEFIEDEGLRDELLDFLDEMTSADKGEDGE